MSSSRRGNMPALGRKDSVAFIENRLATAHTAFNSIAPCYDDNNEVFVPENANETIWVQETPEIKQARDEFLAEIAKYEKKTGQSVATQDNETYSWNDVLLKMQSALERYEGKGREGPMMSLRKCMRSCRNLQKPVESFMRCLPTDGWQCSLVCGGLGILLSAAGKLGEVRDEIYAALEQIPITVSNVEKLRRAYSATLLEEHSRQMLVAILQLYREVLIFLRKNPTRKYLGAVFQSDDYAKALASKRETLEKLSNRIDKTANVELHVNLSEVRRGQEDERAMNMEFRKNWESDTSRRQAFEAEFLNRMNGLLSNNEQLSMVVASERQRVEQERQAMATDRRRLLAGSKRLLLQDLDFDRHQSRVDLTVCLEMGEIITAPAQDRTAWILHSTQVRNWLFSAKVGALVVNAGDPEGHETHSTVSFFSAMLVHSLKRTEAGVLLYWFCGEHIHEGPKEMVSHMLGQLVHYGLSTGPLSILHAPKHWKAESLTDMLIRCLAVQLEQRPVFLVADSISFYEDRQRSRDTIYLFNRLHRLAQDGRYKYKLKVLATSPVQSSYLGTFFDETRPTVLSVPEVVDGANSGINRSALTRGLSDDIVNSDRG